jgi:peptidoglycan/LPS O-acetylase OafA/YrhL
MSLAGPSRSASCARRGDRDIGDVWLRESRRIGGLSVAIAEDLDTERRADDRAPVASRRLYIPALDGIRFVAFGAVFFHHVGPEGGLSDLAPVVSTTLMTLARFGWIGVDIFLCLSGLLITTLLLREIDSTGAVSIRRFYARRVLRIWPLYYLMLAIAFLIAPLLLGQFGSPPHLDFLATHLFPFASLFGNFSYAYFTRTFGPMAPSAMFMTPLWTIALEEQFYLLFPLVLATVPFVSTRTVCWAVGGGVVFSALTRLYILANGIPYPMVWSNTFAHIDPILMGIAGAYVWHRHRALLLRTNLYGAELVLAIAAFWLVMSFPQVGQSFHTVWQLIATATGSLLLIVAALRYHAVSVVLSCSPVAWLGRISYGLYVFHILASWVYFQTLGPYVARAISAPSLAWFTGLVCSFGLAVTFATISYYGYERRFLRAKERFAMVLSRKP